MKFSVHAAHSLDLLLSARTFFMEAAFEEIDRVYGGTEGFLKEGIGLSDSELLQLKTMYLT